MSQTRQQQERRALRRGGDRLLERLLSSVADTMVETLESLVDRPLQIHSRDAFFCRGTPATADSVCIRGRFDTDDREQFVRLYFSRRQVVTLACLMMMTSDETIIERRTKVDLNPDDIDTFVEIGNVLCAGLDTILSERLKGAIGLRFDGLEFVEHLRQSERAPQIAYEVSLRISSYPAEPTTIVVGIDTADDWTSQLSPTGRARDVAAPTPEPDRLDDVPVAPIRGQVSCFIQDPNVIEVVRRSCRRVGLELHRHGASEAPNPTAHKSGIILMDVPLGQDRRFDWCKRFRLANSSVQVVLLVHHPSRARVLQGLMAKADVILGWPLEEAALSGRLAGLLESTS